MSSRDTWRVLDLLDWTTAYFEKQGIETARLDAELLLAHARGCDRMRLYLEYAVVPRSVERAQFRELVKRRAAREPVAYLTGVKEFFSLPFLVGPEVLIPRPETETLVEAVVDRVGQLPTEEPLRIVDLGTGSGAIAVALAKALHPRSVRVVATDVSPEALALAERNAIENGVADAIEFRCGDLFKALAFGETYHVVASNPPYIPTGEFERLEPEVRNHEPRLALDGGLDGLAVIRQLVAGVEPFLESGGWLALEVGLGQAKAVTDLIIRTGVFKPPETIDDIGGIERVVLARLQ